jgi:hypothetical protein
MAAKIPRKGLIVKLEFPYGKVKTKTIGETPGAKYSPV